MIPAFVRWPKMHGMSQLRSLLVLSLAAALLALLGSCAPAANVLKLPYLQSGPASAVVRFDPPAAGGTALVRLDLWVHNPNPVNVELLSLNGTVAFGSAPPLPLYTEGPLRVPAQGSVALLLDVQFPLNEGDLLFETFAAGLLDRGIPYRVDGALELRVLGSRQPYPPATLLDAELPPVGDLTPPELGLLAVEEHVHEGGKRSLLLSLRAHNEGPIGYVASIPNLELWAAGAALSSVELVPLTLPAGASREVVSEHPVPEWPLVGGPLGLRGEWVIEVPELGFRATTEPALLLSLEGTTE